MMMAMSMLMLLMMIMRDNSKQANKKQCDEHDESPVACNGGQGASSSSVLT